MLKNYFLVAIRNLRHNKLFSLINILGLAIGISASLVIFLIVGGAALLLIALIVICLRTFRAAAANPVRSLHSE